MDPVEIKPNEDDCPQCEGYETCISCGGSGFDGDEDCGECDGSGECGVCSGTGKQ